MIHQAQWKAVQIHLIPTPTVFPVGPANIYLYTGDPITLFDAGTNTDEAWEALNAGIAEAGISITAIEQVILTHHHLDHIGLVHRIRAACGAKVIAHSEVPRQIPYMTDEEGTRSHLDTLFFELGAPDTIADEAVAHRLRYRFLFAELSVDEVFEDQATIGPFIGHFRPGHSATDTLFTHAEHHWAVTGDHLIYNVTPNPLLRRAHAGQQREKSLVQYHASLGRTRNMNIDWCFAGHGTPFQNHRDAIDATLGHIEKRGRRICNALPQEGATPYEVARILFPKMKEDMFYYSLSAVTSHLELLEEQQKVVCLRECGVLHYYPSPASA